MCRSPLSFHQGALLIGCLFLNGCFNARYQDYDCGDSEPILLPDGDNIVFTRSWCNSGGSFSLLGGDPVVRNRLVIRDLNSGRDTVLNPPNGVSFGTVVTPAVSPDSRYLMTIISNDRSSISEDLSSIVLYDLVGKSASEVTIATKQVDRLDWLNAAVPFAISENAAIISFGYFVERGASIYAYDRESGGIEEVSLDDAGNRLGASLDGRYVGFNNGPAISVDGRYVAFLGRRCLQLDFCPDTEDASTRSQVYVRDRVGQTTSLLSKNVDGEVADSFCTDVHISGDGRFVTFQTGATNLGSENQDFRSTYIVEVRGGPPRPLHPNAELPPDWSCGSDIANALSFDAGQIIFAFFGRVVLYDRVAGTATPLNAEGGHGCASALSVSRDGGRAVFEEYTDGENGLYLYDVTAQSVTRIPMDWRVPPLFFKSVASDH